MKRNSFKAYLTEQGIQFQNVIDDDKETVFGHTANDYVKGKGPQKLDKKQKLQMKLRDYILWANAYNK